MITFTTKRLSARLAFLFSNKNPLINTPPEAFERERPILKENIWRVPDLTYKVLLPHPEIAGDSPQQRRVPHPQSASGLLQRRSRAMPRTSLSTKGGAEIGAGHPQVYIQLNTRTPGVPVSCKWCGIRYALNHHH